MPAPSETTGAELQAKIGKDFPRMRVLLVDRHSGARHTLRSILSTLGFTAIHNAATSTEVMRQIKGNDFDLILSDYHLDDGRDGQQLLEELRELALDQPRRLGRELDVASHDFDEGVDVDVHRQGRWGAVRCGVGGLAGGLHATKSISVTRNTRISRNDVQRSGLGRMGGTASLMQLEKIRLIKAINPNVEIGWDGGVMADNAYSLVQGGVDVLNVGSAIQKAGDPQAAFAKLQQEIAKTGVI